MKICLLGDFSGTPDEGMKNISFTLKQMLEERHEVITLGLREAIGFNGVARLKSFSPDVIHYLHGPTIRSLLILKALKILLGGKVKIICSATRPYFSEYSRWAIPLLKPDLVLTQSQVFEEFFQAKGCNVEFVANGVDCKKFSPVSSEEKIKFKKHFGLPLDKKIVLHVGHIKENRKLGVFKKIQDLGSYHVVIVGGTSTNADVKLKEEFEQAGITIIHKYLEDISVVYKAADIYVFPIKDAGGNMPTSYNQVGAIDLPLSIFEAMACNLPIITTKFGALQRLFSEAPGFSYVDNDNEIINKLDDDSWRLNCDTRKSALDIDWPRIMTEIESRYSEALAASRPVKG